jgi:hypothetical protein
LDRQQAALEGFLRFNDEDIALNRDGRLSPRQRRDLLWSAGWRLVVGPAVAVVAGLVAAVDLDTAFAILIALIALCIGLQLAWSGFAFMVDATAGAVAFVTAQLNTSMVRGRSTSYFVKVGPVTKGIRGRAYAEIHPGGTYHLFYAPGCRSLLSLEPASATEPLPAHPFGPDSAHDWDRLRWSWMLLTVGVFGALLGAHEISAAHPAHPVRVAGVVQNYDEETTSGRGGSHTERSLYLAGDDNVYTPREESYYTPPAPDFYNLIGKNVVLYVNDGTTDVLALSDGDTVYAGDWYLHPEHETAFMQLNGALITATGAGFLLFGLALFIRERREAEETPGRSTVYVPPTVHPLPALWTGVLVLIFILAFIGLGIASYK